MVVMVGVQRCEEKKEELGKRGGSGDGGGQHQHPQGQGQNSPAATGTEPADSGSHCLVTAGAVTQQETGLVFHCFSRQTDANNNE